MLDAYGYVRADRSSRTDTARHRAEIDHYAGRNRLRLLEVFVEDDPAQPTVALDRLIHEARRAGQARHVVIPTPAHLSTNPLTGHRHVMRLRHLGLIALYVHPTTAGLARPPTPAPPSRGRDPGREPERASGRERGR